MGLFDDIVGGLEAKAEQQAGLYGEIAKLVTDEGGVSGLMQKFEQNGVGGVFAGWVGNGTNPPITSDQIVQAIGQDKITEIAGKVGLSEQQVADGIAKILPVVINHLTPNGTATAAPAGGVESALGDLKSKLLGS